MNLSSHPLHLILLLLNIHVPNTNTTSFGRVIGPVNLLLFDSFLEMFSKSQFADRDVGKVRQIPEKDFKILSLVFLNIVLC